MTADQVAEAATEFIARKLEPALDEVMGEVAAEVRQLISEPYPPASRPGEAPHRRSGGYSGSWTHRTTMEGDVVRGEAGTTKELGVWLEEGTGRMAARPHVATVRRRLGPTVVDRIKSKL